MVDVLRRMPDMLEIDVFEGRTVWFLWNQTTTGENFCEKWNEHPQRAQAFFAWHAKALADFEQLTTVQGLDQVRRLLSDVFGAAPATEAIDLLTERISLARATPDFAAGATSANPYPKPLICLDDWPGSRCPISQTEVTSEPVHRIRRCVTLNRPRGLRDSFTPE